MTEYNADEEISFGEWMREQGITIVRTYFQQWLGNESKNLYTRHE